MPTRPPKSAPSRIPSKRSHALKDIEDWVLSGTDMTREITRHAGQLAENVTEERLLRTKLMELGKERYKALAKHHYEKQAFADKQKRKFAVLRKNRIPAQSAIDFNKPGYAQSILTKSEKPSEYNFQKSYAIRPKTVQFESNMANVNCTDYIATGIETDRPNTVPTLGDSDSEPQIDGFCTSTPMGIYNQWSRPSTAATSTRLTRSVGSASSDSSKSWVKSGKVCRYGSRFQGLTQEPRYARLEESLSETYTSKTKLDVNTIVKNIGSLHTPGKTGSKEAKHRLEGKIKAFMKEAGIVF